MSIIIDRRYASLAEAIKGTAAPQEVQDTLALIDIRHLSYDGLVYDGQIVMHRDHTDDILGFFELLLEERFPVKKVVPIVAYAWDDNASMESNNTSGFNYRLIAGTDRVSWHCGHAFDLNPVQNPFFKGGSVSPLGAVYDPSISGTLVRDSKIVSFLIERGWVWGGNWTDPIDYQHFQKTPS